MDLAHKPLVSILIPVYNRESIIAETVKSATSQSYSHIEIVIIDNKSSDNTWSIIKSLAEKDKRIKIYRNDSNIGPVLNWNEGLKLVNGDFTKILWSDDLISENFIEETLKMFDIDTAFVMSPVEIFDNETGKVTNITGYQNKQTYTKEEYLNNLLLYNNEGFMLSPGCALFRSYDLKRSLILDIPNTDGLDFKKYGAGNDLLMFLITLNSYQYIRIAGNTMSRFRSHRESITVRKNDNLNLYYEWSKQYFIMKYQPSFKSIYKLKLAFSSFLNPKLANIYNSLDCKLNLMLVFKYLRIRF